VSQIPQSLLLLHCPSTCRRELQRLEERDSNPIGSDFGRKLCVHPETAKQ
jgi:hypothetical protein